MKKAIYSFILISCLLLTSCVAPEANGDPFSEYEIVRMQSYYERFPDLQRLEAEADLIVIGEYGDETTQDVKYVYSEEFSKDVISYGKTVGNVNIIKYLKGKVDGDRVEIAQSYAADEKDKQLIAYSSLTPMKAGDKWLFFLSYDEYTDLYWIVGDVCGRYPLPDSELSALCKSTADRSELKESISPERFGVYDINDAELSIYCDILSSYDLTC